MINQAATHHFLPAQIQGAGREREGGGAGPSPRPLQAPGQGQARRAPPSLTSPPPARPALSSRLEEAANAPPAGLLGGGEAAGQARAGLPRPGWEEERRRGAGECPGRRGRGRLDSSRGGLAGGLAGRLPPGPRDCGRCAAGVLLVRPRLDSQREALAFSSRPFLICLQIPFHFAHSLARSGIMQELAIFAVRLFSNKNMREG